MLEKLIELALGRRCQSAEVYTKRSHQTPVEFENNRLKLIQTTVLGGVALRVIKDGKVGFATTTRLSDPGLLVDNALAVAEFGAEGGFLFPGPAALPTVKNHHDDVLKLSVEAMVEQGRAMVGMLNEYDPKVMAMAQVHRAWSEVRLINSSGFDADYTTTTYALVCGGELVEPQNFLSTWDYVVSARAEGDPGALARGVIAKFQSGRINVPVTSGKYPVILTPEGLSECLGPLMACINGQAVYREISPWRECLGEEVAAPSFTVYDDPLADYGVGTVPFDDEGVPSRRLPIIERGVLTNFIYDLRTAAAMRKSPTGNGKRASLSSQPTIDLSNLSVEGGNSSFEAMLKDMQEGIVVDRLMGAWSGNPYSGQINGNIMLGYKVENGQITGRVKDCMFSINSFDAFKDHLVALSKERKSLGSMLLPYVLLSEAGISTRS
ncbi:MAG: TldD/PmbA family protein [Bacillota bacterium]